MPDLFDEILKLDDEVTLYDLQEIIRERLVSLELDIKITNITRLYSFRVVNPFTCERMQFQDPDQQVIERLKHDLKFVHDRKSWDIILDVYATDYTIIPLSVS